MTVCALLLSFRQYRYESSKWRPLALHSALAASRTKLFVPFLSFNEFPRWKRLPSNNINWLMVKNLLVRYIKLTTRQKENTNLVVITESETRGIPDWCNEYFKECRVYNVIIRVKDLTLGWPERVDTWQSTLWRTFFEVHEPECAGEFQFPTAAFLF